MGKSRSRSLSPRRRDRERERERNRERDDRLDRDRDRRRKRSREHSRERRRRSTERSRRRSRSRSSSRTTKEQRSRPQMGERPQITEADLEGKTPDEQEMMKMMGFCGFDTTKGKKVQGNNIGDVHVILKRKYRQYMNRKGGFNRPLDFVA